MSPPFRPGFLRALLLAVVLLAAQLLLAVHQSELAQHVANDHCEWCLAHTPLTGTLPVALPAPPVARHAIAPPVQHRSAPTAAVVRSYVSRAPPLSLPV